MDSLTNASTDYSKDEQAWLMEQAAALQSGRLAQVDRTLLSEYLFDMAARDRRDLRGRLTVLLAHIIKCQIQPSRISRSCVSAPIVQQGEIKGIIEDSATLSQYANDKLGEIRVDALKRALVETGLTAEEILPVSCPASLDSMLTASFEPVQHPMLPLFKRTVNRKR